MSAVSPSPARSLHSTAGESHAVIVISDLALYVSDLDLWLRTEVKRLSNGTQTPHATAPQQRFTSPRIFIVRADPG